MKKIVGIVDGLGKLYYMHTGFPHYTCGYPHFAHTRHIFFLEGIQFLGRVLRRVL